MLIHLPLIFKVQCFDSQFFWPKTF